MPRLADLGLTLADIDLGGTDAEADTRLAEDFVRTGYVDSAVNGPQTLFLGRKGSGKSALFAQLPTLLSEAEPSSSTLVVQITPDQYAWAALKQYEELGLLREQAHTNAWRLTVALELAGALIAEASDIPPEAQDEIDRLRSFLEDNFGEIQPGLARTSQRLLKGLQSFNLNAFGFGVGIDRTSDSPSQQPLTPALTEAVLSSVEIVLRVRPCVVELDRLDDAWDGSPEAHDLLVGLLKASKDLNDRFRLEVPGELLRVLVFLRSDIYSVLRFDDKDKHRATEVHIVWSHAELTEMLNRRLPDGLSPNDLFEHGEMRGRLSPFSYLLKRTFLRPREVLQFVSECLRRSSAMETEISKEALKDAENLYSTWKVEDLKQEFRRALPHFELLLEALRQELHRYDSLEELSELLANKAPGAIEDIGTRNALEVLFDASVIGIRVGGAGSTRFKAEEPDLALPAIGAVYIHQSLYKGLNIREARATSDPVEEDEAIGSDESEG